MKKILLLAIVFLVSASTWGCGVKPSENDKSDVSSEGAVTAEPYEKDSFEETDPIGNPYFPYMKDTVIKCSSNEEISIDGKADWQIHPVRVNESGKLCQIVCDRIYERDGEDSVIFDGKDVKDVNVSYYFWVTKDKIYCMDDDMTEKEKSALIENNRVPDTAIVVCQKKDMEDSMSAEEVGRHELIESHDGDVKCYRSWSIHNKDNPEGRDCVNFIWKKDVGLIGYRYSRTAPGADSIRIWNPEYLDIWDLTFDIEATEEEQVGEKESKYDNPIDAYYMPVMDAMNVSETQRRSAEDAYRKVWKDEFHNLVKCLKKKCVYREDKEHIQELRKSVEKQVQIERKVWETEMLDTYEIPTHPTEEESYSRISAWGNGTRSALNRLEGELYRDACMRVISIYGEGDEEYEFRQIKYQDIVVE